MKKSVVVVEDDPGLREQLVEILDQAADIKCVGAFESAEEALKIVPIQNPDVVLMDIGLPGMSGIECVVELKKTTPSVQIIMVTVYEDSERIFRALKAGASGYLVKSSHPDGLLDSVRDLFGGGAPMSSHIARKVVMHFHLLGPAETEGQNLSPREGQVLSLLASGLTYREIAKKLEIGTETVRSHVKNICHKMHVRNRVEAVAKHRPNTD
ncbi:MAG TPA: response regulator transcription factor [Verrucomicrobiae bacterium]|jgi:DNA-binding NarL/FixJ family response regulator|nr:response regulator transcription factor [Verrucomicrobiae bacterium]